MFKIRYKRLMELENDTHTHTQTNTQDEYCNPRAHAPSVNKAT